MLTIPHSRSYRHDDQGNVIGCYDIFTSDTGRRRITVTSSRVGNHWETVIADPPRLTREQHATRDAAVAAHQAACERVAESLLHPARG